MLRAAFAPPAKASRAVFAPWGEVRVAVIHGVGGGQPLPAGNDKRKLGVEALYVKRSV